MSTYETAQWVRRIVFEFESTRRQGRFTIGSANQKLSSSEEVFRRIGGQNPNITADLINLVRESLLGINRDRRYQAPFSGEITERILIQAVKRMEQGRPTPALNNTITRVPRKEKTAKLIGKKETPVEDPRYRNILTFMGDPTVTILGKPALVEMVRRMVEGRAGPKERKLAEQLRSQMALLSNSLAEYDRNLRAIQAKMASRSQRESGNTPPKSALERRIRGTRGNAWMKPQNRRKR